MSEAMVEGKDNQCAPGIVDIHTGKCLFDIGGIITVRQDNPFRVGCRTGCISDGGIIVIRQRLSDCQEFFQRMCLKVFFSHSDHFGKRHFFLLIFWLVVKNNHLPDKRQLIHDRPYLLQLVARYHDVFHVGMHQAEQEIVGLFQLNGKGHIGGSGIEHGQLADDPGVAAFA